MHVILECIGLIVTGVPRQLLESFPGIFLTARTVVRSIFKNNKVSSVPSYEESLLEDIDLRELGQLQNFLLRTLESEEKEDTHAFIRYGEVYLSPWNYPPSTRYYPYPTEAYLERKPHLTRVIFLK